VSCIPEAEGPRSRRFSPDLSPINPLWKEEPRCSWTSWMVPAANAEASSEITDFDDCSMTVLCTNPECGDSYDVETGRFRGRLREITSSPCSAGDWRQTDE